MMTSEENNGTQSDSIKMYVFILIITKLGHAMAPLQIVPSCNIYFHILSETVTVRISYRMSPHLNAKNFNFCSNK